MKYLLILLIRLYWLIPKRWRRKCIFKESCSLHVYSTTKEQGFIKGLKALKIRFRQCRPNYSFYTTEDKKQWVILKDKTVIERSKTNL